MLLTKPTLGQATSLSTRTLMGCAGCRFRASVDALCRARTHLRNVLVRLCLALVHATTQPSSIALPKRSSCAYAEKRPLYHILGTWNAWERRVGRNLLENAFAPDASAPSRFRGLIIEARTHCGGTARSAKRRRLGVRFTFRQQCRGLCDTCSVAHTM